MGSEPAPLPAIRTKSAAKRAVEDILLRLSPKVAYASVVADRIVAAVRAPIIAAERERVRLLAGKHAERCDLEEGRCCLCEALHDLLYGDYGDYRRPTGGRTDG